MFLNLFFFLRLVFTTSLLLFYSFLIAARGLSRIARRDGKKPATMPTRIANTRDSSASHGGI